jgi:hypothetical protein
MVDDGIAAVRGGGEKNWRISAGDFYFGGMRFIGF